MAPLTNEDTILIKTLRKRLECVKSDARISGTKMEVKHLA